MRVGHVPCANVQYVTAGVGQMNAENLRSFRTDSSDHFFFFFNYYFAFLETLSHRFKSLPRLHEDYENPPLSGKQPPNFGLDNSFKRPKANLVFITNSWGCKQDMFCPRWSRCCSSVSAWQEFKDIDPEPVSTHTVSTVKMKQSSTVHVWSWTSHVVLSLWWC